MWLADDDPGPAWTLAALADMDPRAAAMVVVDPDTGCWIWTGAWVRSRNRPTARYGKLKRKGKMWLAHRYVHTRFHGEIAAGDEIHHRCRETLCVHPRCTVALDEDTHRWIQREIESY